MKSKLLVFMQFIIILIMTLPFGTPSTNFYLGMFIMAFGGIVGILALRENSLDNFNIRPDIKENSTLVQSGIYSYIRHPMYLSVLVMMFGIVVLYPIQLEYIAYVSLAAVLLTKLLYEEKLWKVKDSEYGEYMKKTKRLIPFIF